MLLEIENLKVDYFRGRTMVPAVRGVSLSLAEGETLALAGESGCGKSTLSLSILGLIVPPEGRAVAGRLSFDGRDLTSFSAEAWRSFRGREAALVFQDPFSSLNPVMTAGDQIDEAIAAHRPELSRAARRARVLEALREVRFDDPERIRRSWPHQLSGGQRQRVAIAMAIVNRPRLLIADEPTTALDVTIQKEIMDLIDSLKRELSLTVLLITHNLALAGQRSNRLAIMYNGEIVERGETPAVFRDPRHPYTRKLIEAIPRLGSAGES